MRRADQRTYHYIYKITRDDGRFYIGMHSTDNLEDGYFGSGNRISRSIKKHGKERHVKQILQFCASRNEAKAKEKELLTEDLRADPKCMNIAPGGGGGFKDEAHQLLVTCAATKYWRGRRLSAEHREKLTCSAIGNANGVNSSRFTGKICSEQHRRKIGEKNKMMTGEKNSQFGTCWVTNGVKPIKIKKEQVGDYLSKGYRLGRK